MNFRTSGQKFSSSFEPSFFRSGPYIHTLWTTNWEFHKEIFLNQKIKRLFTMKIYKYKLITCHPILILIRYYCPYHGIATIFQNGPYHMVHMFLLDNCFACLLIKIIDIEVFKSIELRSTIHSKYMKCNSVSVLVFNVSAAVQFIN